MQQITADVQGFSHRRWTGATKKTSLEQNTAVTVVQRPTHHTRHHMGSYLVRPVYTGPKKFPRSETLCLL